MMIMKESFTFPMSTTYPIQLILPTTGLKEKETLRKNAQFTKFLIFNELQIKL